MRRIARPDKAYLLDRVAESGGGFMRKPAAVIVVVVIVDGGLEEFRLTTPPPGNSATERKLQIKRTRTCDGKAIDCK